LLPKGRIFTDISSVPATNTVPLTSRNAAEVHHKRLQDVAYENGVSNESQAEKIATCRFG
jgi:hypothetical protein